MPIYALSIRQPYAWAILHGDKTTEFREWKAAPKQRGWIAIHAGLKIDHDADVPEAPMELPIGAILGLAFISDATRPREVVHIHFSQRVPLLKPIPYKGKLGFFPVEGAALKDLKRQAKKLGVEL